MSKSYDIDKVFDVDDDVDDLTTKTCTRVHSQTLNHGVHYGNCDLVTVKAPCNCMAAFDTGILIGSIFKLRSDLEY